MRDERQYAGMAGVPMGIPFTAVDRYAQRYGFNSEDEFDELLTILSMMDAAYLRIYHERAKKEK